MELHHDLVALIFEKLPVKSLLRFKSLSREWKLIIESRYFNERQLIFNHQSKIPNILIITRKEWYNHGLKKRRNVLRILTLNSSDEVKLHICPPSKKLVFEAGRVSPINLVCGSCDGMICYYNEFDLIHVVNPTTRWSRSVPHARFQALVCQVFNLQRNWNRGSSIKILWGLGFGKDKITNTYKLVWLYNSFNLGLENTTTCDVFDFSTNTWRDVTAAPCRILEEKTPSYVDGSLYWFTDDFVVETRILSFDLHTENFQIMLRAPFVHATDPRVIIMCNLNNRLCVSQKVWPRQEIWSLSNSDMTWEKIYSFNLPIDSPWFDHHGDLIWHLCVIPVMVMDDKKTLVLFDVRAEEPSLVLYDPESNSYKLCFAPEYESPMFSNALPCIQSLISIE